MALAAELTVKLDLPFGAVDYAFIEQTVHEALVRARVPVIDVEMDGLRDLGPTAEQLNAPDFPLGPAGAPVTPAPGARY